MLKIHLEILRFVYATEKIYSVSYSLWATSSFTEIPKRNELLIKVSLTGGSGPARVWGHVKSKYSAEENTEWPPCLANHELT